MPVLMLILIPANGKKLIDFNLDSKRKNIDYFLQNF